MTKHHDLLQIFGKLSKYAASAMPLDIMHFDDPNLHISSEEDVLLIIQAVDAFITYHQKPASLHPDLFYRYVLRLLDELHSRLLKQEK